MERITHEEFLRRWNAQGVPYAHVAFVCPMCGTVQSATSLMRSGVAKESIEGFLAFSCVGRWTNAGPHQPGTPPGRGCDWTLGGLFRIHKIEVEHNGRNCPIFEFATPEQATSLMQSHLAIAPAGQEVANV